MQPPTDIRSEDLVRMMRAAHKVSDVPGFRSAADRLEQRHRQFIVGKATQKLRSAGLLHLVQDVAHEIFRRLLEDVQGTTLKRTRGRSARAVSPGLSVASAALGRTRVDGAAAATPSVAGGHR